MINLDEQPICLKEATRLLPSLRCSRRIHVSTLHRWSRKGVKGVRLETIRVGGTHCTSIAALERFFARLAQREGGTPDPDRPAPPERRVRTAGRRDHLVAEKLESIGF